MTRIHPQDLRMWAIELVIRGLGTPLTRNVEEIISRADALLDEMERTKKQEEPDPRGDAAVYCPSCGNGNRLRDREKSRPCFSCGHTVTRPTAARCLDPFHHHALCKCAKAHNVIEAAIARAETAEATIEQMRNNWVPGPQVATRELAAARDERERIILALSADNEDAIPGMTVCKDVDKDWIPADRHEIRAALEPRL